MDSPPNKFGGEQTVIYRCSSNPLMAAWEVLFRKKGRVFQESHELMGDVVKLLEKEKARTVLDLGCGSGRHTVHLAKKGFKVHATDVSKTGLKLTRKWLKEKRLKAKVKQASCFERLPFDDAFFDAVISTQVIHHNFHDKVKACIAEIERTLKPGGIVFVTVATRKPLSTKFDNPEPRTFIPLDGEEAGLPHFVYTKKLLEKDFKNFEVLTLRTDKTNHYCILARLKPKDKSK